MYSNSKNPVFQRSISGWFNKDLGLPSLDLQGNDKLPALAIAKEVFQPPLLISVANVSRNPPAFSENTPITFRDTVGAL